MHTYLEPDFEIEGGAVVTGGMQKAESNAAVDSATEKDSNSERLITMGHTAREIIGKKSVIVIVIGK